MQSTGEKHFLKGEKSLTQDHSSKLSFSIEESVWLNKDQEVDEILSLSLDPEITVQEHGEYVLIRGGLRLTGEYRQKEKSGDYSETESLSQQVGFRSIEEVTIHDDGTSEIRHYFPIDVTIPQERINSLDDIYVLVESFDYDLPERGCIQLTADVAITGMSPGNEERKEEKQEYETVQPKQDPERSFHFEATQQEDEEETPTYRTREDVQSEGGDEESVDSTEEVEEINEFEDEADLVEESVEDRIEVPESESTDLESEEEQYRENAEVKPPTVAFGVKKVDETPVVSEVPEEQEEKVESEKKSFSMLTNLTNDRPKKAQSQTSKPEQVIEDAEVEVEEVEEQEQEVVKPREENALYLTKMLSKGEEQFSKLKMCIVQTDETLAVIASRYKVNSSTLIHVNKLSDERIEEGQILYIPVKQ